MIREVTRAELRTAIANYRKVAYQLNEHGHRVLDRLTPHDGPDDVSHLVLPAFRAVRPDWWTALLYSCVRANQEQRRSGEVVEECKWIISEAARAQEALAIVEDFLDHVADFHGHHVADVPFPFADNYGRQPDDVVAFPLVDNSHLIDPTIIKKLKPTLRRPERAAFEVLRARIASAREEAVTEKRQHSRNSVAPSAKRAAALGWIKAAIRKFAPNARNWRKITAYLATAVLHPEEDITEDMIKSARTPREWQNRARLRPKKSSERAE